MEMMTSNVITVDENASVQAVAKVLVEHGISAVPVVGEDNRVIGMVGERDLPHRPETGTERGARGASR
jgi:CBS domain-containing protein